MRWRVPNGRAFVLWQIGGCVSFLRTMDKARLSQHMADHFRARGRRFSRADAREFLAELQRVCARELAEHGETSVPGIAKLRVETRLPRVGRDPVTGQPMQIPRRRIVQARISRLMRRGVEGPV